MDAVYLRPFTNPKRVKLVSTCDVCKNRKVKCDRERPECGTCKKTNRKCSYTYAALTETMRDKQTGMKAQADSNFIQTQLNYLQKMQFGQLYDESGYLSMASRGFGIDVNNSQHVPGMLSRPMTMSNVYDAPDDTSILTSEVLQYSSNIVSSIPRDTEQQQYDPYYLNNNNFSVLIQQVPQLSENYLPQTSIPPQQFHQESHQQLSPQQSPHQQMPQQPPPHQPPLQLPQQLSQQQQQIPQRQPQQFIQQRHHVSTEDTVMEDLITNIKNMNLYESTRYIGEGSLLMLDEDNIGEMIIPQMTKDISEVDKSLKILPNEETAIELIHLYYKHVHRYFPAIREEIVWNVHEVVRNAPGNLSKPQDLLLLNCIFFIASPFHDDPDKKDGRIYFDRAEALLYEYCTQPHALTVMAIVLLGKHNRQMGSRWMYNGIATKMLFELGLHRKFIKVKIDKEVEKTRNEAFWMTFISENLVSATYGRPNMIDETDCDVDVPSMPYNQNPTDEKTKLEIAYIYLINLSRICARVRKYMHASSRLRFLMQEDENKFRVLDAALASWFNSLPDWLKFEKMVKDPDGVLLNGIGGDIHIFFYTILILLHSRYMKPQAQYNINTTNSSIICIQSATIIVHWLEILLEKHTDFFKFSVSGSLAINPAMCVFSWHINSESENNKKSRDMLQRLEIMKLQVDELSNVGKVDYGERRLLGIETSRVGKHEINARDWEVFIPDDADDEKSIRRQYSWIARKQAGGGHFMPRKQKSKSLSHSSSMSYTKGTKMHNFGFIGQQNTQEFNFTFKTDRTFNFSAFSSGQNLDLPQLTVDGIIVDEPEQLEHQINQQFGSQYHTPLQRTSSQQSPQLEPQQFHTPLSQSPQEDYHPSQLHLSSQEYNSPLGQSPHISPHISPHMSHEGMDTKLQHIDTSLSPQQYIDQLDDKNNINNNVLWTPPLSARPQRWNHDELSSNALTVTSLPMENTMLTPPMHPQDFLSDSLNEFEGDELWNVLQNENNFGTASKYDNNNGHNNGGGEYDSVGLGISVMGNNDNIQ